MTDIVTLYVLNMLLFFAMLIVTVYRAWVEKQNLEARRKLAQLKLILTKEADAIKEMTGEEFIDMLKTVLSEK